MQLAYTYTLRLHGHTAQQLGFSLIWQDCETEDMPSYSRKIVRFSGSASHRLPSLRPTAPSSSRNERMILSSLRKGHHIHSVRRPHSTNSHNARINKGRAS